MAVGFQPFDENDAPTTRKTLKLPGRRFIKATSQSLDLILLDRDCETLRSTQIDVRRLLRSTDIFCAPHVLVAKGFTSVAFADIDVSFQDALRGIHGPKKDRNLLIFLAAYLRSSLARYFLFHTSANWGVSRQVVDVEEILRLPFPLPDALPDPKRSNQIVREVVKIVENAAQKADADLVDRVGIVQTASEKIEPFIDEYFDVLPLEKQLITDTVNVIIDSTRPTRARPLVPTLFPATKAQQRTYSDLVCEMLNGWAKSRPFAVRSQAYGSGSLGVGIAVLEKVERNRVKEPMSDIGEDLIHLLNVVRKAIPRRHATLDVVRGVMVFDGNRLYVVKPIGQRFWTQTAAMNDADEIAATILMRTGQEDA